MRKISNVIQYTDSKNDDLIQSKLLKIIDSIKKNEEPSDDSIDKKLETYKNELNQSLDKQKLVELENNNYILTDQVNALQ